MSTVIRKCQCCGADFTARSADVKRGWAHFCSKSCKAVKQEQRTGQNAQYRAAVSHRTDAPTFSNAHQFDNTEL
ncbi:hypothetical protein ABL850_15785 [Variovorax paradoxus]|uniref:hypothetical protein n=1 Tax=Variovorax paradoxus TaxID=34073 RepID=UPI0004215E1E